MAAHPILPDGHDIPEAPCECPRDECGVRYRGYVREPGRTRLRCDRPVLLTMSCGHRWAKVCGLSSASRCGPCSSRVRRLVARKCEIGLLKRAGWFAYLLTTTGPGENDHDQWDPGFIRGTRPRCGCHLRADGELWQPADWNPTAGKCWNRLRTALRREIPQLEFHRFAEVQKRGVLHHHTVIVSPVRLDPVTVQAWVVAAGYGCTMDLVVIPVGDEASMARYVAKYVTKGDDREECPWRADVVDEETGEIRRLHTTPTYKTHSSSRGWGITMREIREHLRAVARAAAERAKAVQPPDLSTGLSIPEPPAMAGVGPPT